MALFQLRRSDRRKPALGKKDPNAAAGKTVSQAKRGGSFAHRRQQDDAARAEKKTNPEQRKPVKMKKTMEMETESNIAYPTTFLREQASTQELIAPHEFQSLLNSFENENSNTDGRVNSKEAIETQISSDALWERLSSTRWLKSRPKNDDIGNRSTVAQRPL